MRSALLVFVAAATVYAAEGESPIGLGVRGGVPLNDAFVVQQSNPIRYVADTHRYIFGPYAELRLPLGFSFQLEALYKTLEYQQVVPAPTADRNFHSWEFPALIKKRFLPGPFKPYAEVGAAFNHLSTNNVAELTNRNAWGLVVGGGVDLKLGALHFTPEIRYTGWNSHHFDRPGTLIQDNSNQAAVMLGIGF